MIYITRTFWVLGNLLAQIVFAFRIGWREGSGLRPGSRPKAFDKVKENGGK